MSEGDDPIRGVDAATGQTPKLSVVLITANRSGLLDRCLESLKGPLSSISHEIILVDNASVDDTVNMVKRNYPEITLILNQVNRGVAPARNQALRIAKGELILIFDDDAMLAEGSFEDLIAFIELSPEIGLVGVRVLRPDGSEQDTKRGFPAPWHVLLRRITSGGKWPWVRSTTYMRLHQLDGVDLTRPLEVNFLEGVFQLIKREAFLKVGLLDESMFYGFEDSDYCARMQKAGYKCFFYPYLTVRHEHGALTRKNPVQRLSLRMAASYVRFYLKHRKWIGSKNREQAIRLGQA